MSTTAGEFSMRPTAIFCPATIQLPARPGRRDRHRGGFPPEQAGLAFATFVAKVLMPEGNAIGT
jgi:hypothetical protein